MRPSNYRTNPNKSYFFDYVNKTNGNCHNLGAGGVNINGAVMFTGVSSKRIMQCAKRCYSSLWVG